MSIMSSASFGSDDFAITTPGRGTRVYNPAGQLLVELAVDIPVGGFPGIVHIEAKPEPDWQGARCHAGTDWQPWAPRL